MDKWLKIRRHDWKEPLQISQPAKFLIAWDQALRWKGGGGVDEEESKLGVGEKKNDHRLARLARLAHRYFPIWPRFLPFPPPKGLKKKTVERSIQWSYSCIERVLDSRYSWLPKWRR